MAVLGIDFGTSNTAAGVVQNGKPQLIALENGADTLPTVIFMDFDSGETLFGQAAVTAMTEGRDGRFLRALKSVLGTPLARERRQFLNEKLTLLDVIGRQRPQGAASCAAENAALLLLLLLLLLVVVVAVSLFISLSWSV